MIVLKVKRSQNHWLLFIPIWLMTGFALGTETLMGPVRWLADTSQRMGWPKSSEKGLVIFMMITLVAVSFWISLWFIRNISASKKRHVRLGIPLLLLLVSFGSLYFWLDPRNVNISSPLADMTTADAQYTFGSFPDKDKLQRLKDEGFTAVISLLHPAVVPFEPKLLEDEKRTTAEVGIELIHLPLLPWVGGNQDSLEKLKALVETGKGKYYVHCYLGKDRINIAKRIIENTKEGVKINAQRAEAGMRDIRDVVYFERGKIYPLEGEVFVTPYPTDEEFFAYILNGSIKKVVSLMDPEKERDVSWIKRERNALEEYRVPFEVFPVTSVKYNPQRVLRLAHKIKSYPKPVLVHGFSSPSYRTEAFIAAFRYDLPPLAPSLFDSRMEGGKVQIIAPNIAIGPRPTGPEFGSYLHRRGIRNFAYLGEPDSAEARRDRQITQEAGYSWQIFPPYSASDELYDSLAEGGPWFLYGPYLSSIQEKLTDHLRSSLVRRIDAKKARATREGEKNIPAVFRNFVKSAIPSGRLVILLGPFLLLYTALGAAWAGRLRMKKVQVAYTRKIFHFYIFTMAGILHLTGGLPAVVLFGVIASGCVFYALLQGDNHPFYEAMARPKDAPHRSFFIIVPLATTAVGGLLSSLFFRQFAYLGYFVGGWGDAVGEPVGAKWGNLRYKVPSLLGVSATRSLEGSFAVLIAGSLVAFLGLSAVGTPFSQAVYVALACGTAGAIVEAISTHGMDNLTIQIAAAGMAYLLLG